MCGTLAEAPGTLMMSYLRVEGGVSSFSPPKFLFFRFLPSRSPFSVFFLPLREGVEGGGGGRSTIITQRLFTVNRQPNERSFSILMNVKG